MGKILEFKTDKKHRFGKDIDLNGNLYSISKSGIVQVKEEDATAAALAGFIYDGDEDYQSNNEALNNSKEVEKILSTAKEEAFQIVENAKVEANKIILEAKSKAKEVVDNSFELEKEKTRKELSSKKLDELKNLLVIGQFPEAEYSEFTKKDEIIDYLMKKSYE